MTLEQRAEQGLGADLALEGGGVKGIGLVGAVLTLHQAGYVFPRVAGTSAGAIVAALVAAYQARGVQLSQVERDMRELDYTQFMEKSWAEKHLGTIGQAGLEQQIEVVDAYPVVDAVRASMSIPYFFQPFQQATAFGTCTWVDGGLLQDFPVTVFNRTDDRPNRWPTFGVKLSSRPLQNIPDRAVHSNIRELVSIAHTAFGQWNRYPLADDGVGARTVFVDTMNISATDFSLSAEQRDCLFRNGCGAAARFLAAWDAAHRPVPRQRRSKVPAARPAATTEAAGAAARRGAATARP